MFVNVSRSVCAPVLCAHEGLDFFFSFFECTFSGLEVCACLARAHVCQGVSMCLIVSLHVSAWAAACDSHGSVVPF